MHLETARDVRGAGRCAKEEARDLSPAVPWVSAATDAPAAVGERHPLPAPVTPTGSEHFGLNADCCAGNSRFPTATHATSPVLTGMAAVAAVAECPVTVDASPVRVKRFHRDRRNHRRDKDEVPVVVEKLAGEKRKTPESEGKEHAPSVHSSPGLSPAATTPAANKCSGDEGRVSKIARISPSPLTLPAAGGDVVSPIGTGLLLEFLQAAPPSLEPVPVARATRTVGAKRSAPCEASEVARDGEDAGHSAEGRYERALFKRSRRSRNVARAEDLSRRIRRSTATISFKLGERV